MSTDEAITTGQSHFHQLSCIDNNSVTEQYSLIKKMFAINNSPKITSNPVQVLLISSSKENINYSILSVNSKATQQRLLFAAVDKNWEYLGDLIGGGKQYATEKSSITPELQIKINNSKYKGFLKENVLAN